MTTHNSGPVVVTTHQVAHLGFKPAFRDKVTGEILPSLWANGQPCPIHNTDMISPQVWENGFEAGFVLDSKFFTRAEAEAYRK